MKSVKRVVSVLLLLAAAKTFAQDLPISTDGTDPRTWDPKQDAAASGKKNHVVIFEDSEIRVLSVTVAPGETEVPHHHQWPSVIVYDRPVKSENRDGKGNLLAPKRPAGDKVDLPHVIRVPPEALHSVTNLDTAPLHLVRTEFKNGFPKQ
jgi:predicted metal-dependent enzyme (double-stranded beta helix superfamily)